MMRARGSCDSPTGTIAELPVEILLKIFSHLDHHFLVETVSFVCKRFLSILRDEEYWKIHYYRLLKGYHDYESLPYLQPYGLLSGIWRCEPGVFWKDLTLRLKSVHNRWSTSPEPVKFHSSTETVDVVYLLKNENVCITGSRERCIDLWAIDFRAYIRSTVIDAHRGWITCLDSFEKDCFLSGAWDSRMALWNIGQSTCESMWSFNCGRPLMAIASRWGLVVAGVFSPQIILVDPRISEKQRSTRFQAHGRATVSVALDDNYIVSVGRDMKLCVSDLRKMAVVHRIHACQAAPRCLALRDGVVFVGDTKGFVHFFSASDSYRKFHQMQVARNFQVAEICPDIGYLYVGCSDHFVRVIVPAEPFYKIKELDLEHEVTSMSFRNQTLAVGKVNGAVDVFRPK